MMRKILKELRKQRVNWIKTLIINFKCLPFSQAKKMPIHVFSDTIISSYGKIMINSQDIHPGMIKIGRRNFFKGYKTYFVNAGTIEFCGQFMLEGGSCINNMGGYIRFGAESRIAEICKLLCMNVIEIGRCSRIAFGTVIMDTDFHYVVDTSNKCVRNCEAKISIGAYNWFGNNCSIMKGSVTPDYAIFASKSLCNKDYSQAPLYPVFAGSPAKCIADGMRRIYNKDNRIHVMEQFKQRDSKKVYVEPQNKDWDFFCMGGTKYCFPKISLAIFIYLLI